MKTQCRKKILNTTSQSNWISLGKYLEIQRKNIPYYGDLYHYAGNNPVRYVDPDGRVDEYSGREKYRLFQHIKKITKQDPHDIIKNFNANHSDNPIDDNVLCELFADPDKSMKLLMEREDLHKDLRYQLNEKASKTEIEAKKEGMINLPWYMSIFHNPIKNNKYVAQDGHMEGVYDKKTGESDERKSVVATFNFFDPNLMPDGHEKADVKPYLKWGN